ncbi:MAG: Na/Pi cotransporter family protein [Christensenellales bacterium]
MDIFSLLSLAGGMAFFLFGMNVVRSSLEKMSGSRLERNLRSRSPHPLKDTAPLLGLTMALRPSTSATAMLAGMVCCDIIDFGRAAGVVMGMNLAAGSLAWLLSLFGIPGENALVRLVKPEFITPLIAVAGVAMLVMGNAGKRMYKGRVLLGFAIMFQGMQTMISALGLLAGSAALEGLIRFLENPFAGILAGALAAGLLQSLPASLALLQALSMTGAISLSAIVPVVIGQSAGVGIVSLIISRRSCRKAKNMAGVAAVQFWANMTGAALCLVLYYGLGAILGFPPAGESAGPAGVALIYSGVAAVTLSSLTLLKVPLERFLQLRVKKAEGGAQTEPEEEAQIDESLLMSSAFSIAECRKAANKMAALAKETLLLSIEMISAYDEKKAELILKSEDRLDRYEDSLSNFLVKLSSELTAEDSRETSKMLLTISDFERIGDHAVNILASAREMQAKGISFSRAAQSELAVICSALEEILHFTNEAFVHDDGYLAAKVEPLEQVIDELGRELKSRHITRLQHGLCTIEQGFIFSDLLSDFERVSDHCSNIAVCVIQIKGPSFEAHGYLDEDRLSKNPEYVSQFRKDKARFSLPLQILAHEFEATEEDKG